MVSDHTIEVLASMLDIIGRQWKEATSQRARLKAMGLAMRHISHTLPQISDDAQQMLCVMWSGFEHTSDGHEAPQFSKPEGHVGYHGDPAGAWYRRAALRIAWTLLARTAVQPDDRERKIGQALKARKLPVPHSISNEAMRITRKDGPRTRDVAVEAYHKQLAVIDDCRKAWHISDKAVARWYLDEGLPSLLTTGQLLPYQLLAYAETVSSQQISSQVLPFKAKGNAVR